MKEEAFAEPCQSLGNAHMATVYVIVKCKHHLLPHTSGNAHHDLLSIVAQDSPMQDSIDESVPLGYSWWAGAFSGIFLLLIALQGFNDRQKEWVVQLFLPHFF